MTTEEPQSVQLTQAVSSDAPDADVKLVPQASSELPPSPTTGTVQQMSSDGGDNKALVHTAHKKSFEEILKNFGATVLFQWFKLMHKYRRVFFVSWIVLLGISAFFSLLAFTHTGAADQAPEGSLAYEAWKLSTQAYKSDAKASLLVLVQAQGNLNSILDGDYLQQFSTYLNDSLADQRANSSVNQILDIQGYYLLKSPDLDSLTGGFVSTDGKSSFIVISYLWNKAATGQRVRDLVKSFSYSQTNMSISGASISTGVMGGEVSNDDLNVSIETDLITFDAIAIFVILVSFYVFFRKFRFLILPVLNFITSILFSLALLYPIEQTTSVSSIAISIMLSMGLAFSTDYTLFYVARYLDELRQNRRNPQAAVAFALRHIGEIVFTSGSVLLITFLFLLTYKNNFLHGVGIGVSLICSMSIFVNTTITPMLFLNFPIYFSKNLVPKQGDDSFFFSVEKQAKALWYKMASLWSSKRNSTIVIIAVLVCSIPFCTFAGMISTTIDNTLIIPRNSETQTTYSEFKKVFSAGNLSPYSILIHVDSPSVANPSQTVFSNETWELTSGLISELNKTMGLALGKQVSSFTYLGDNPVSPDLAALLVTPGNAYYDSPTGPVYRFLFGSVFSADNKTVLISILTDFDPTSDQSMSWIPQVRNVLASYMLAHQEYSNYKTYIWGGMVSEFDSVTRINAQFPQTIITNFAILLIMVGIAFKSVLIPLRSVLTIGLSVAWAYGITVLYFQQTLHDRLYWLGPIMTFSIVTGLGLDYDIFLIAKVYEYMEKGFSTSAAITKGMYRTGNIITGAGIIMGVSFIGQLFSQITLLNQIGTILVSSVLLDTFLVRTVMVPAILQLIGDWNWWPGIKIQELRVRTKGVEYSLQTRPGQVQELDQFTHDLMQVLNGNLDYVENVQK
jgi:RND superfamily putative drug exporter